MRFLKLNSGGFHTPIAKATKYKDNLVYNYTHGFNVPGYDKFHIHLSKRDFKPTSLEDVLPLDKDYYVLSPLKYKDGNLAKDKHNRQRYCVFIDENKYHSGDIVLFWEVPNRNYENIVYKVEGSVDILVDLNIEITRNNKTIVTPNPILLVYGSCKLYWSANIGSEVVKQEIVYDYSIDEWSTGDITKEGSEHESN